MRAPFVAGGVAFGLVAVVGLYAGDLSLAGGGQGAPAGARRQAVLGLSAAPRDASPAHEGAVGKWLDAESDEGAFCPLRGHETHEASPLAQPPAASGNDSAGSGDFVLTGQSLTPRGEPTAICTGERPVAGGHRPSP